MTKKELAAKIALDVAPMFGGRVGKWIGGPIGEEVGEGIGTVFDHQKGLFDFGKSIFYDPKN